MYWLCTCCVLAVHWLCIGCVAQPPVCHNRGHSHGHNQNRHRQSHRQSHSSSHKQPQPVATAAAAATVTPKTATGKAAATGNATGTERHSQWPRPRPQKRPQPIQPQAQRTSCNAATYSCTSPRLARQAQRKSGKPGLACRACLARWQALPALVYSPTLRWPISRNTFVLPTCYPLFVKSLFLHPFLQGRRQSAHAIR